MCLWHCSYGVRKLGDNAPESNSNRYRKHIKLRVSNSCEWYTDYTTNLLYLSRRRTGSLCRLRWRCSLHWQQTQGIIKRFFSACQMPCFGVQKWKYCKHRFGYERIWKILDSFVPSPVLVAVLFTHNEHGIREPKRRPTTEIHEQHKSAVLSNTHPHRKATGFASSPWPPPPSAVESSDRSCYTEIQTTEP